MAASPTLGWGFRIEGVGQEGADPALSQSALLWTTDAFRGHEDLVTDEVRPHLIHDSIGAPMRSMDFYKATHRRSTISFELEAKDRIVERFLAKQKVADGELTGELTIGGGPIQTDVSGSLENSTIFIGDETLILGSETATPGEYNIDTRGAFGSQEHRHPVGSNVFTSVPDWEGRLVVLSSFHHTGGPDGGADFEEEERWRGRITRKASQTFGRVTLQTAEALSAYSDVIGGGGDRRIDENTMKVILGPNREPGVQVHTPSYTSKIIKPGAKTGPGTDGEPLAVQAFEELIVPVDTFGPAGGARVPLFDKEIKPEDHIKPASASSSAPGAGNISAEFTNRKNVYEVMAFSRTNQTQVSPLGEVADVKKDSIYSWHILSLYAAVHFSTPDPDTVDPTQWDVLQDTWGLNVKDQFTSSIVPDLEDLIERTRWATIDRLIWGHNGETVDLRDRLLSLMRGYGFKEGIANDGKLTIFKEGALSIDQLDAARSNTLQMQSPSRKLTQSSGGADRHEVISAEVGKTPITEGEVAQFTARGPGASGLQSSRIQQSADLTLDLSTVDPDRINTIEQHVVSRLLLQAVDIQRATFTVPDFREGSLEYGIGDLAELDDPPIDPEWLIDREGERVAETSGSTHFVGRITKNRLSTGGDGSAVSYALRMVLLPAIGRLRAPSGIVRGGVTENPNGQGNTRIPLEGEGGAESTFGDTEHDGERFTAGDETELFAQSGEKLARSEVKEVVSVNSNGEVTVDGLYGTAPQAGDVLELAFLETDQSGTPRGYTNDGLDGQFDTVERVYVYLSDHNGTLGSADVQSDRYGG